jgi:hypothetical protein
MRLPPALSFVSSASFGCLVLAFAASGCASVPVYERGRLAHPSMVTSDLAHPSEEHVRAVQEGAIGGGFTAGTGCGCN